jgi:hypothetical protein
MVRHHVAQRPGRLVELAAPLHVINPLAAPDRFEQPIGQRNAIMFCTLSGPCQYSDRPSHIQTNSPQIGSLSPGAPLPFGHSINTSWDYFGQAP